MVVDAEDRTEIQIEMDGYRRTDEPIAVVGPKGEASAPGVVELELGPVDEMAVAIAEDRIAVAQVDELLALLVEIVLQCVAFETEVEAKTRIVEEPFPFVVAVGLASNAEVGPIHRVIGIVREGNVIAVT